MTEQRIQYTVQANLFGGEVVAGDVVDRLTYILQQHPEARSSYRLAMYYYWVEFDGLNDMLRAMASLRDFAMFKDWLVHSATSPKTLQNRCMEIQRARADLQAPPEVAEWRQKQARAGRVR